MKNKRGESSSVMIIIVVAIAVVVYLMTQKGTVTTPTNPTGVLTSCAITPSWNTYGINAFVANSNVTPTSIGYVVNGVYKGTAYSPSLGDNIQAVGSLTGYIATVTNVPSVTCDKNNLAFTLKQYANASVTVYSDSGLASLTLTGLGTTNESAWTSGQTKVNRIRLVGVGQKSTSKIFTVIEYPSNSGPNVTSNQVQLSCGGQSLQQVSIPSAVTTSNTNALRVAYEIPALDNGAVIDCYLSTQATAGKLMGGGMLRITLYGEQPFIDSDGTVKTGIYDSNGNAKFIDSYPMIIGITA